MEKGLNYEKVVSLINRRIKDLNDEINNWEPNTLDSREYLQGKRQGYHELAYDLGLEEKLVE